jgi:hypothetical protein
MCPPEREVPPMFYELAGFYAVSVLLVPVALVVLRITRPKFEILILEFAPETEAALPLAA